MDSSINGPFGPNMAKYGQIWPNMAIYRGNGPIWPYLAPNGPFGPIWAQIAGKGPFWPFWAKYGQYRGLSRNGPFWPYRVLSPDRPKWPFFGPFEPLWAQIWGFGPILACFGLSGPIVAKRAKYPDFGHFDRNRGLTRMGHFDHIGPPAQMAKYGPFSAF